MLEYSRDAIAGPLEALGRILADVREGRFHPDALRSGRRGAGERIVDALGYDTSLIERFEPSGEAEATPDGADAGVSPCRPVGAGSGCSSQASSSSGASSSGGSSDGNAADAVSEPSSERQADPARPKASSHVEAAAAAADAVTDDEGFADQAPYEDMLDGKQVLMHPKWGTYHLTRGASGLDASVTCGKPRAGLVTKTAADAAAAPADSLCLRCFRTTRA